MYKFPPMRTKVQSRRLLKLIEFLEKLPRKKFDFATEVSECKTNGHTCATVACAIGWTPELWPRLVKWHFTDDWYGARKECSSFFLRGEEVYFKDVARDLFGVNGWLFAPGEQNEVHSKLKDLSYGATPKQVAKMLRQYMTLVP